jgi:hypothetical protein
MSKDQKEICEYCAAFSTDGQLYYGGTCRKKAPGDAGWPRVNQRDWCLEFTERRDDHNSFEPIGEAASRVLSKIKVGTGA